MLISRTMFRMRLSAERHERSDAQLQHHYLCGRQPYQQPAICRSYMCSWNNTTYIAPDQLKIAHGQFRNINVSPQKSYQ